MIYLFGTFSVNLVNEYCGGLDGVMDTLVSLSLIDRIDGQCFRAEATADTGLWMITIGAALLAVFGHFVQSAARQQVDEISWSQSNEYSKVSLLDATKGEGVDLCQDGSYSPTSTVAGFFPSTSFTDFYFFLFDETEDLEEKVERSVAKDCLSSSDEDDVMHC